MPQLIYRIVFQRSPRNRERVKRYMTFLVLANNPQDAETKVRAEAYRKGSVGYKEMQELSGGGWEVRRVDELTSGLFRVH